jgi:putative transposase
VIPAAPVRQWVFSLPYSLRYRVAFDAALFGEVLGIMIRSVFEFLKRRARDNGIPQSKCGAVACIQRFGSALNLNPHGHFLVLDGVYAAVDGENPAFYPVRPPEAKDVALVSERVAMRVAALLEKQGGAPAPYQDEPGLAAIFGASITGRIVTGPKAGQRLETFGDFQTEQNPEERFESSGSRCALVSGFSVHAGVAIRAVDRKGLERLCKYVMRPPLAAGRLAQLPDGRLSYQLKTPWKNGTTHVIFEPLEFMARLAALVPVPRVNMVHCYGVIAPTAKWRGSIVPESSEIDSLTGACECEQDSKAKNGRQRNHLWSTLMSRVFEIDVLKCPDCNGCLKILAAIHPPVNTRKILECMGLPSRAPPVARAASESALEKF